MRNFTLVHCAKILKRTHLAVSRSPELITQKAAGARETLVDFKGKRKITSYS